MSVNSEGWINVIAGTFLRKTSFLYVLLDLEVDPEPVKQETEPINETPRTNHR